MLLLLVVGVLMRISTPKLLQPGMPAQMLCPCHPSTPPHRRRPSTQCSIVATLCLGKRSCEVSVGNAIFGGDPCPNADKYLAFKYT